MFWLWQLVHFLAARLAEGGKLMVYFLTCACVDYYSAVLPLLPQLASANLRPLHGKMAPKTRTKTYDWFVNCKDGSGAALPVRQKEPASHGRQLVPPDDGW